jgi:hypothetical protein
MKVKRLFRTLAFQPDGKDVVRGPEARGTLAIIETDGVLRVKFIRDGDSNSLEFDIESFDVFAGVPTNMSVAVTLPDGKMHRFTAYKELPPADNTIVTIATVGMNPMVKSRE